MSTTSRVLFDKHIRDMEGMCLLLKEDSTYETNTVLEYEKAQTGKFSFDRQTKILVLTADSTSISGKFQVTALDVKELSLSEITSDTMSSMTFRK